MQGFTSTLEVGGICEEQCCFMTHYAEASILSIIRGASTILSTFIKLPFVIKTFVLSIFEWLFYTGFTVQYNMILYLSSSVSDKIKPCPKLIDDIYLVHSLPLTLD